MDIEICDIKSAYVSCRGVQKIYVDSLPPEFGELAGRGAYVKSNLYGLPTAGAVFAMDLQTKLLGVGLTFKTPSGFEDFTKKLLTFPFFPRPPSAL